MSDVERYREAAKAFQQAHLNLTDAERRLQEIVQAVKGHPAFLAEWTHERSSFKEGTWSRLTNDPPSAEELNDLMAMWDQARKAVVLAWNGVDSVDQATLAAPHELWTALKR